MQYPTPWQLPLKTRQAASNPQLGANIAFQIQAPPLKRPTECKKHPAVPPGTTNLPAWMRRWRLVLPAECANGPAGRCRPLSGPHERETSRLLLPRQTTLPFSARFCGRAAQLGLTSAKLFKGKMAQATPGKVPRSLASTRPFRPS